MGYNSSNYTTQCDAASDEFGHLATIIRTLRPRGLLNLTAIVPDGRPTAQTFDMPSEVDAAARWTADQNEAGSNVYFTVNPVKDKISKKPTKADIARAEYAHVDIDPDVSGGYEDGRRRLFEETLPELKSFQPRPAFIIDSGNGLAAFWRLEGAEVETAEDLNRQLIERFGGDPGTHNIDRLMRLPGTLNYPTKKKIEKGYPSEPRPATLLHTQGGSCSPAELRAALPELPTSSGSAGSAVFSEHTTALSAEEIEAVDARLDTALERSPSLRQRWEGRTDGLKDTSRSGFDFSMTALLKAQGFTFQEVAYLLVHRFEHGRGQDNTERDLQRNWSRSTVMAPQEIVSLCVEAHGGGDPWEPVLYAAHPSAQSVDAVLDELAERSEFAGKRALRADYTAHAEKQADVERMARIQEQAGNRIAQLWDPTRLNDMVDRVEDALRTVPGRWEVLLHGGIHSRVAVKPPQHLHMMDAPGATAPQIPVLEPYNPQGMLLRIEQSVSFYAQTKDGAKPIPVPNELPKLILNKPDPALPVTVGLVSHPLLLPNSELLLAEGLHQGSGIYAHFGGASFVEPSTMTAAEGLSILRDEMLAEFEFATDEDRAAALALVLTAVERKAIDTAPGFMVNASSQGSGKTTLVRMAHLLVTGHDMPVATMSENIEEQKKELTAMLLASVPVVCFDNVPDGFTVASPVLAKALTSPTHSGRILGLSKMVDAPTNTVFVVTGNNITADLDLSRRLLEVRLAPKDERPEQRRFQHPDVVAHVLHNRSRWMKAVLAILKGNRTPVPEAAPSGFPQWDSIVRWPLVNAGAADPVGKFESVREKSPDHERLVAWMLGLVHGFGVGTPFRAKELMALDSMQRPSDLSSEHVVRRAEMYADYLIDHPPPKGWANVLSIGRTLKRLVGRTIEGYTLRHTTVNGTARYKIEQV